MVEKGKEGMVKDGGEGMIEKGWWMRKYSGEGIVEKGWWRRVIVNAMKLDSALKIRQSSF